MWFEKRRHKRYRSLAKAEIEGYDYGESLLTDLSILGCRIECTMQADLDTETEYKIKIIPEQSANIGEFEITAELKWSLTKGYTTEMGFCIVKSPKGRFFQRYLDYLAWRAETPAAGLI